MKKKSITPKQLDTTIGQAAPDTQAQASPASPGNGKPKFSTCNGLSARETATLLRQFHPGRGNGFTEAEADALLAWASETRTRQACLELALAGLAEIGLKNGEPVFSVDPLKMPSPENLRSMVDGRNQLPPSIGRSCAEPHQEDPEWTEAEQQIIATILRDPTLLDCADELKAEHFFDPLLSEIFRAMRDLSQDEVVPTSDEIVRRVADGIFWDQKKVRKCLADIGQVQPCCQHHALNSILWFATERRFYRGLVDAFAAMEDQNVELAEQIEYLVRVSPLPGFRDSTLGPRIVGAVLRHYLVIPPELTGDEAVFAHIVRDWVEELLGGGFCACYADEDSIATLSLDESIAALERLKQAGRVSIMHMESVDETPSRRFRSVTPLPKTVLAYMRTT